MDVDAKILNTISVNQIQKSIERIIHHDQVIFSTGELSSLSIGRAINVIHHIMHKKKNMIISVDARKAFGKVQCPLRIKTVR